MRSLALDPTTGDLLLTAGRLSLVEGVDAIAQRIQGRLALWAGEWFADTSIGVPFLTFLGAKGGEKLAESSLRRAILTCPGVASLESFGFTFDARSRSAVVAFRAKTADGQVVEDGGFRVGV